MSKIFKLIKDISPLNNRTEMPVIIYVVKVVIVFWFVKFASELIGEGFVMGILFACGKNPMQGEVFDYTTMTLISYFGYGFLIGIVILYWKLFQKKTLSELGFTGRIGTYSIGALIGTVLIAASVVSVMLTGAITYEGVFENINYGSILLMFAAFIFQGAFEEMLCRGVVLQLLKEKTTVLIAVSVSTVLFVIPHLFGMERNRLSITVMAVVCLVLVSLIFSLLTLRLKSIWAACGMHSVWNFILYNVMGLNLSGNDIKTSAVFDMRTVGENILNGGNYGIEASIVTAFVLTAALALMYCPVKRKA